MVSFSVEQKGISLLINTNFINAMKINGDERRLTQILLNLLSNAVKFTSGGKICVSMEYTNQNLIISVEDTGAGIKDEDKSHIFKPFTQLEATSKMNQNGTGLGLYISRELARRMNGELSFASKFCIGTKFTITLFKVEIVDQISNECQIIRRRMRNTKQCKILVIDDNTFNLFSISSLLTKQGLKCITCLSGIKAIEECKALYESRKSFYQLILMDIEMPIMDGFEVYK
jgi:anti-sigma regulatory factor (Ser/Thr protein kinase)